MYNNSAHNIYAQNNVDVESPSKLIEMLYEGILRFNAQAKKAIHDDDVEKRVYWTNRSIAIITELIATLDMQQGEISQYLEGLYNYQIELLIESGMYHSDEEIDECSHVFKTLLEAWRDETSVA
ncbi:MAG: flagellar export chaperone FliS [Campylobacterota bacterium]|nr:flagellar export chaperone FliS [Campylobacterota bacterium]